MLLFRCIKDIKSCWAFLAVLVVWGCASRELKSLEGRVLLDTTVTNFSSLVRITATVNPDTSALLTFSLNNHDFIIDTLDAPTALGYFEALDFDGDGSSDILFDYIGNNPTYFLYLYDSARQTFREIEGYSNFPDAQRIEQESNLYYSYHRAGCSDMNWVSDLFEIKDFGITHLAHLYGQGCESAEQGISIYRVIDNDKDSVVLAETLPFSSQENASKWDIIKTYWNKSYVKFGPEKML